jgi:hypothetical protein
VGQLHRLADAAARENELHELGCAHADEGRRQRDAVSEMLGIEAESVHALETQTSLSASSLLRLLQQFEAAVRVVRTRLALARLIFT